MAKYEDQFCDAVEILINEALSKARFDRTYQAIIKDDTQAEKGIYKVQYQDAIVSASPIGNEVYSKDELVYILVPEDNWSKEKKIIGYAGNSSTNTFLTENGAYWISSVERVNDNLYYIGVTNGTNSIISKWTVNSDKEGKVIWTCDSGQIIDMIGFNGNINDDAEKIASTFAVGMVKIDGSTISIATDGTIRCKVATSGKIGMVKPDNVTIKIKDDGTISCPSFINGKTIIGLGDSLLHGGNTCDGLTWLDLMKNYGMKVYNYAKNSASISTGTSESNSMLDILENEIIKKVSDCDYFVVLGGANDKRLDVAIEKFCGDISILIDKIRAYYPKAHIIFLTNYCRNPQANSIGKKEIDYVNAMISTCQAKHVFCYDNYRNSGVDFTNSNFAAWADESNVYKEGRDPGSSKCHFSYLAYEWLLPKYKAIIESN